MRRIVLVIGVVSLIALATLTGYILIGASLVDIIGTLLDITKEIS